MGRIANAPDIGAYVYIFNCHINGVYKIGVSSNPARRLTEVGYAKHVITSGYFAKRQHAYSAEAMIHASLSVYRRKSIWHRGRTITLGSEWFRLPMDVLCDVAYELLENMADEYGVTPVAYNLGMQLLARQKSTRGLLQRRNQGTSDE